MPIAPLQIKALARAHTETAIRTLAAIMNQKKCAPAARVVACQALLDRGWGKPTQPVSGDDDAPPLRHLIERVIIDPKAEG